MSIRKRIGMRRYKATFTIHNGNVDDYGQYTYDNPSDWTVVAADWPCELITTVGAEVLRGRMTNAKTTHVAYGDFYAVKDINAKHRCEIDGVKYGITCVMDTDGLQMERRIELRGENDA